MRVAPPVQALSCSAGPWLSIQLALYALSTAVAVWWTGAQLWQPGAWLALPSLLLAALVALVARRALLAPARQLGWDSAAWRLGSPRGEAQAGQAMPMLDLGGWMLVRFRPAPARAGQAAVWLPLSRRDAGAAWPALRVALYAPQPAA